MRDRNYKVFWPILGLMIINYKNFNEYIYAPAWPRAYDITHYVFSLL